MTRKAEVDRITKEVNIKVIIDLDGTGKTDISTEIPFFDHMLTAFAVHGLFDLTIRAKGDIEVDFHHTVEDTGLVLGQALSKILGNRKGINRYGESAVPMDEAFSQVNIDLSNRPYLVYNIPDKIISASHFNIYLAKEFFRAFSNQGGLNLHINSYYGENEHHIIESIFKAFGRALRNAVEIDSRFTTPLSTKGTL